MTIACRFGIRPEPTVQNSQQPAESTQPTFQNSQQPTESTQPTAQIDLHLNTQSVSFDIIPYEIKDRPDDFVRPGYKYVDIYVAIKNTGTDWVFFNKINDLIRPIRLITDREIYDIRKDTTENFLSAPGTTVKGIGKNLFYMEFEIASTLRPIFLQLQYSYIPFDEYGSTINSSRVYSDPITLDLQNLSNLVDVPFSPEMVISTLPFTYELPKGM
jgi:hypothetical protein